MVEWPSFDMKYGYVDIFTMLKQDAVVILFAIQLAKHPILIGWSDITVQSDNRFNGLSEDKYRIFLW